MQSLLFLKNSTKKINTKKKNIFFVVFWGCFFVAIFFWGARVFSADLSSGSTVISDSRPSTENVNYVFKWSGSTSTTTRCILIQTCTTWTGVGPCNLPPGIDTTGATKGNFQGLTSSLWSLDASTNGNLKLTSTTGETPGSNVSLEFFGIKNPSSSWIYYSRVYTYSDVSCSSLIDSGWSSFTINPGVVVTARVLEPPPPTANVVFIGKTSPLAIITISMNGSVMAAFQAGSDGNLSRTLTAITPGTYTFSIFGEDRSGTRTSISSYTLNLVGGMTTTVSGIFLSPTISLSKTRVYKGEKILISGEGYPGSIVNLYLSPGNILKQTMVDSSGFWSYSLDTTFLSFGEHSVFAMAISPTGEHSGNTQAKSFSIVSKPTTPSIPGRPSTSQPTRPIEGIVQPPVEGLLIYSSTHPDQKAWYSNNVIALTWTKEDGVNEFSYVLDENPYTIPDDIPEGSNNSVTYQGIEDGIWYFHIKAKKDGNWWKVDHFLIKIDTTPPSDFSLLIKRSFRLPFFKSLFVLRGKPFVVFSVSDATSGIEHYEIKYDDITWWRGERKEGEFEETESPYSLQKLAMGKYLLTLRAYDFAGNFDDNSQTIFIVPVWLIVVIVLMIVLIIGGGTFWFIKKKSAPQKEVASVGGTFTSGGFTSST